MYDCTTYTHETFDCCDVFPDDMYIDDYHMDERWAIIDNFSDYMISDHGRVLSRKSRLIMKPKFLDKHGHLGVTLRQGGKAHYKYIHVLMANAFIPNPCGYPIVRHLNDIPYDNDLDNLAWGTQKDNYQDSVANGTAYILTDEDREIGFQKTRIPVKSTNLDSGEIRYFQSQTEASRALGIPQANVWKVLNGVRPHAHRYHFEYLERSNDACQ